MPSLQDSERAFVDLAERIVHCNRCPRLRNYADALSIRKKKAFADWVYWAKPLPGFGDFNARLLIVGLAPAAHGGTRTGRLFCGDSSGDWLARALFETGFANKPTSTSRDDGLKLDGVYVSAIVRCAPPGNKPQRDEAQNCLPYLVEELQLLHNLKVVLTLGGFAFSNFLTAAARVFAIRLEPRPRFRHGAAYQLGPGLPDLFSLYHPSQQNTRTAKLTWPMWIERFETLRRKLRAT